MEGAPNWAWWWRNSKFLETVGKGKGVPDYIVWVLDCQVKTFGLHSENNGVLWKVFHREVEGKSMLE